MLDRIEAGTLLCVVASSGGKVNLQKANPEHLVSILHKLEDSGCTIETGKDWIHLEAPKRLTNIEIKTMPYPGFPTDMQSIFTTSLTLAKGWAF